MESLESLQTAINSIKRSLKKFDWWEFVQEDVKTRLEEVLDNLPVLGPPFRDAFVSFFNYQHIKRTLNGKACPSVIPGSLFGSDLGEEQYRCGIEPVRCLLSLEGWTLPNDADVFACIHICRQIELFDSFGVFKNQTATKVDLDKTSQIILNQLIDKAKDKEIEQPSTVETETISWEYE